MNRVEGQDFYLKDLNNSSDYDPNRDFVLNPSSWSNPGRRAIRHVTAVL